MPEATPMVNPVAGTKLLMKRSDTQNKKPAAGDAEYGELFINYHSNSPMLCFKNNADAIVEIRPLTEVELALGELTDVDTSGATSGMVLSYDGAEWVPVSPASLTVEVDLGYTAAADKGTVTNSAGDDATIPLATGTNAGLSLNNYSQADKDKLDGYPSNPGDAGTPPSQTWTPVPTHGTLTLQPGGDQTVVQLADGTNAGLMSPGDKNKIDGYPASPDDIPGTLDLQAVTDNGNTTTKGATFGGNVTVGDVNSNINLYNNGQLWLKHDSSDTFQADVFVADDASVFRIQKDAAPVFSVLGDGETRVGGDINASPNIVLRANGSAEFKESVQVTSGTQFAGFRLSNGTHVTAELVGLDADNDSATLSLRTGADVKVRLSPNDASYIKGQDFKLGSDPINDPNIELKSDGSARFAGGVSSDVGTVPNGTGYELHTHNFWEVGAVTVANPITGDLKNGQSGLFILRDAPLAWGTFYKFKGGTPPAPTSYPAVCPFYVNSTGGETYVGPAIEVQS